MCRWWSNVTVDLNKDHKDRQVASLTANPAEFTSSLANNSALRVLMNDGLVRPLNNLVAKHALAFKICNLLQ